MITITLLLLLSQLQCNAQSTHPSEPIRRVNEIEINKKLDNNTIHYATSLEGVLTGSANVPLVISNVSNSVVGMLNAAHTQFLQTLYHASFRY